MLSEGGGEVSEVFTTAKGVSVVVHDDSIRVVYGIADEESIYLSQEDKARLIDILEPQPVLRDIKFEDIKKGDELRTEYYRDGKLSSIHYGTADKIVGSSSKYWADSENLWIISKDKSSSDSVIIDVMKRTWEELPAENGAMIVLSTSYYCDYEIQLVRIADKWRDISSGSEYSVKGIEERGWKVA